MPTTVASTGMLISPAALRAELPPTTSTVSPTPADDIGGHDGGPFRFSRQHIQRLNQQQLQASQFFFLTGGPDVADHLCYLHSLDPSFFG